MKKYKIDGCIVISLYQDESRRQFLNSFLKKLKKQGIETQFMLVEPNPNPIAGCFQSHLKVIEIAKSRGYQNILILEDDCLFLKDFDGTFYAPDDYELYFLGYNCLLGRKMNETTIQLKIWLACHSYIVNKKIYDKLLTNVSVFEKLINTKKIFFKGYDLNKNINDVYYCRCFNKHTYGIYPPITTQREGFSNLENQIVNYDRVLLHPFIK